MDPVLQWILGGVVTIAIAVVSGFIKYLFRRIDKVEATAIALAKELEVETNRNTRELKEETDRKIRDLKNELEERSLERNESTMKLIVARLDAIWEAIHNLKEKVE
jgi:hypothetical protein